MKGLKSRIKERLASNKGELLLETIISILIVGILMAAVANVINLSLNETNRSRVNAAVQQEGEVNPSVIEDYGNSEEDTITFEGGGISVSHQIKFNRPHADGDPACGKCPNYPACDELPCPICCKCNSVLAFAPEV